MRILAAVIIGLGALTVGCDKPNLDTDEGKYSYTMGLQIARSQMEMGVDVDPKAVAAGMKDAIEGKEPRITEQQMMDARRGLSEKMMAKAEAKAAVPKKEGADYMEQFKKQEGVKTTPSGLAYKVVRQGKGPKPASDMSVVKVHYKGTFINGKEFDSSYSRNEPATFPLNGVIRGWTEGLQLMNVGSMFEFVIPSDLAYGDAGKGEAIPGGSTLIFTVELLEIVKK